MSDPHFYWHILRVYGAVRVTNNVILPLSSRTQRKIFTLYIGVHIYLLFSISLGMVRDVWSAYCVFCLFFLCWGCVLFGADSKTRNSSHRVWPHSTICLLSIRGYPTVYTYINKKIYIYTHACHSQCHYILCIFWVF